MTEILLIIVTAIGTLFMTAFLRKKEEEDAKSFVAPKKVVEKFEEIDEEAEEAQEEIKEALDGPTPEDELAKLGDRRRR